MTINKTNEKKENKSKNRKNQKIKKKKKTIANQKEFLKRNINSGEQTQKSQERGYTPRRRVPCAFGEITNRGHTYSVCYFFPCRPGNTEYQRVQSFPISLFISRESADHSL